MQKWQRNYRAEFEIGSREGKKLIPEHTVTIAYPFTCRFHISAGINKGENRAAFQFINLSDTDRKDLWLDIWNFGKRYIYIKFYAGYGNNLPLVFEGLVQQCTSGKQGGSTEYITNVEAFDEGHIYRFGYLNATFTEKTTLADILKLACEGTNLKPGYITPDILPLRKNRTFIGEAADLISREYAGYDFFINKNEIHILGENDVIPGEIQVISDTSGLLGSPERGSAFVRCSSVFEPRLTAGQAIVLQSYTLDWLNQAYKVVRVEHRGIISPVVCGELITDLTLTIFDKAPRVLEKTPPTSYTGQPTTGIWRKPVQGQISSAFKEQRKDHLHQGIDIAAPYNTPVYSPANGKIRIAGWVSGYGKCIYMDNGTINGQIITSRYGHLQSYIVHSGQLVEKGQLIGYVGSTGNSSGPHLHFEIREGEIAVNPTKYIGNYG